MLPQRESEIDMSRSGDHLNKARIGASPPDTQGLGETCRVLSNARKYEALGHLLIAVPNYLFVF